VTPASFGRLPDGTDVGLFTLSNARGLEVRAIAYGAIIVSVRAPDRRGQRDDVVLGCDDLEGYLTRSRYFGAVVGRYGNRIANGRFTLDGRTIQLATNNGPNHLHGGVKGFDKVVWRAQAYARDGHTAVAFSYTSPDGEEAYPGTLNARVSYTLTERNELVVEYEATTDKPTPVNLTQHSYFNLHGAGTDDVLDHELTLAASRFTPVDDALIPTGELRAVRGTPFDFTTPHAIGERIGEADEQLRRAGGYDHNFVIDRAAPNELVLAARLTEPVGGRGVDVYSTEPGIQFYSGNFLDGRAIGKGGRPYEFRTGLALETQHFPDAPNHPEFPSIILRPGAEYRTSTIYHFVVRP
jgi:aldose 1-epimerase